MPDRGTIVLSNTQNKIVIYNWVQDPFIDKFRKVGSCGDGVYNESIFLAFQHTAYTYQSEFSSIPWSPSC